MSTNNQHRATPKQWDDAGAFASDTRACLLELRARIQELEDGHPPSPSADRILALQDQIRDGALSLADALDLGVVPASDVQDAMRCAASKAMSEVSLKMGGFGKNYTYRAPAAPAPYDSLLDRVGDAIAREANQ
jgi:hypothetical protein